MAGYHYMSALAGWPGLPASRTVSFVGASSPQPPSKGSSPGTSNLEGPSLKQVIAESLRVAVADLSEHSGIGVTEGWDSLKHITIVLRIEQAFRCSLPFSATTDFDTVGKLRLALSERGLRRGDLTIRLDSTRPRPRRKSTRQPAAHPSSLGFRPYPIGRSSSPACRPTRAPSGSLVEPLPRRRLTSFVDQEQLDCGACSHAARLIGPSRFAWLSSASVDDEPPLTCCYSNCAGFLRRNFGNRRIRRGEFGQYLQELTDIGSSARPRFSNRMQSCSPSMPWMLLTAGVNASLTEADASQILDERMAHVRSCWRLARETFGCRIIQQAPVPVFAALLGENEHRLPGSRAAFLSRLALALRARAGRRWGRPAGDGPTYRALRLSGVARPVAVGTPLKWKSRRPRRPCTATCSVA